MFGHGKSIATGVDRRLYQHVRRKPPLSRRQFIQFASAGACALAGCRGKERASGVPALDELSALSAAVTDSPAHAFLREAAKPLRGQTIRLVTEDTPPSVAAMQLGATEFAEVTGIGVDWVLEPLDQVYARCAVDAGRGSGHHDLFYIDQSWRARFADALDPLEPWLAREDLAYPNWDFDDFLPTLREHLGTFNGRLIAVPYDIPIFIAAYRRDLLDEMGLEPPRDMATWLNVARVVTRERAPRIHGMTAQWRVGHYALNCNMTAWLWGHGGSIYHADGRPAINDEGALEGLGYMMELAPCVPPGATTWDWHGEWKCFARGEAALFGSWGEFFPMFDNPAVSKVVGRCEPLPMPLPTSLRPPSQCGFGEAPGVAHQGGSSLAISAHSRHKEAAWLFLQWVTSSDVAARACLLGGGASATRESVYRDPRVVSRENVIGPGTTRHFKVLREAILHHMGTEPCYPGWAELSRGQFPVELGRMVTRQQSVRQTADAMARAAASAV